MYEGDWMNNNMHGHGVYTWKDGRKYEGMLFISFVKVTITWIRNMDMAYICGLMEGSTMECGKMVSNMDKEFIMTQMG